MSAHLLRRGPRTDDALEWLRDKPLPEDPRWPDGACLSDVVSIEVVDGEWRFEPRGLPHRDALAVLTGEVKDAVAIHESILDQEPDDTAARASIRVYRRLLGRLEEEA